MNKITPILFILFVMAIIMVVITYEIETNYSKKYGYGIIL